VCFRVSGDGIFQVLKFEYERVGELYHLNIGLRSMYDELRSEWFTPAGCIAIHSVANFFGYRAIDYFPRPNWQDKKNNRIISCHKQLAILRKIVFPELNKMQSQMDLLEMIIRLETVERGKVRSTALETVAPYLCVNRYEEAEKVLCSTLAQHYAGDSISRPRHWQEQDQHLEELLAMVRSKDKEKIDQYLQSNYQRNLEFAKFCMKNTGE